MSDVLREWLIAISQNLVASFIAVLAGLAFAHFVQDTWDRRKYGGYHVRVLKTELNEETGKLEQQVKVDRPISVPKAKAICAESADLSVFLKGVVSPYHVLKCDLIADMNDKDKKDEERVLRRVGRTYIINVDNDKAKEKPGRNGAGADQVARQDVARVL